MDHQKDHRKKPAAAQASRTVFSSIHGVVNVYTRRHINGCTLGSPDENRCSCPKWIYSKPRGGKASQLAAHTPSFTEACELGQKILKGFDPEIIRLRELIEPAVAGIGIEDALDRYAGTLRTRGVSADYLQGSVLPVFVRRPVPLRRRGPAPRNPSLLEFLDQHNLQAQHPVARMEQITSTLLEKWAAVWHTNDLSSSLRRSIAASFFKWAFDRELTPRLPNFGERQRVKAGNRCGCFSDEQYKRLIECIPFSRIPRRRLPANYAQRLRAFVELGRWGGMARADIVRFSPAANLNAQNVLTYRRTKSGQIAVVALDAAVAARLRSIPAEEGSSSEQPMRLPEYSEARNRAIWGERFQRLSLEAKIGPIQTECGTVRKAHPHMLRDTCAIDAILRGVRLENVAKMLGHATVEMTQRAYLFWIAKRVDHCIADQRAALSRSVESSAALAEDAPAGQRLLVH